MGSNECIICLDNCKSKYIQYPVNYSGCSCKYYIHDECNNKWNKNECIICHTPFNNKQIEIENNDNQIENNDNQIENNDNQTENNDNKIENNNNFHHELDENIRTINCIFCRLPKSYFICVIIILFILVCTIVILFIV